jgi:hypothetical protein
MSESKQSIGSSSVQWYWKSPEGLEPYPADLSSFIEANYQEYLNVVNYNGYLRNIHHVPSELLQQAPKKHFTANDVQYSLSFGNGQDANSTEFYQTNTATRGSRRMYRYIPLPTVNVKLLALEAKERGLLNDLKDAETELARVNDKIQRIQANLLEAKCAIEAFHAAPPATVNEVMAEAEHKTTQAEPIRSLDLGSSSDSDDDAHME